MTDDPIGRLRAEMDQAREGMKETAGNLWAFYSSLVEEGFSTEQAMQLTLGFLSGMMFGNHSGDAE